ncbi:conserved hypothetical protein [uncultured Alphaproteobacteria bacterium]|uniref:L-2-amino-thiazoline-4-carboxylic acid hydrolase n=1 Tax=uncultured Alphaproteobacteria bacterium TaxID=91750 RepID=A0A212KI80_9PROT|nr:conserved hypothetical protein [uncultured Alphaproteobacteria bacterium]
MPASLLERRRIEAEFALNLMREMTARFGEEAAREVLSAAVKDAARAFGRQLAAGEATEPDLGTFAARLPMWQADDALEIEVLEATREKLSFNVHRCRYAEIYKEIGAGGIGDILSCERDGEFCVGYAKRMKLARTQTKMKGADYCDFRYTMDAETGDRE